MGLDNMHFLSSQKSYRLKINAEDVNGQTVKARFIAFSIQSKERKYSLYVLGSGQELGDGFDGRNLFTARDVDNDKHNGINSNLNRGSNPGIKEVEPSNGSYYI